MCDHALIRMCQRVVDGRATSLSLISDIGCARFPTEVEAGALYEIAARNGSDIAAAALMPSNSLAGCHAKASVLHLLPNDDLAGSLALDILTIATARGGLQTSASLNLVLDNLCEVVG